MWVDVRQVTIYLVEDMKVGLAEDARLVKFEDEEQSQQAEGLFDTDYSMEVEHLVSKLLDDWIKEDLVSSQVKVKAKEGDKDESMVGKYKEVVEDIVEEGVGVFNIDFVSRKHNTTGKVKRRKKRLFSLI